MFLVTSGSRARIWQCQTVVAAPRRLLFSTLLTQSLVSHQCTLSWSPFLWTMSRRDHHILAVLEMWTQTHTINMRNNVVQPKHNDEGCCTGMSATWSRKHFGPYTTSNSQSLSFPPTGSAYNLVDTDDCIFVKSCALQRQPAKRICGGCVD